MVGEYDYGKIGITDKGDFVPGTTVCEELDGVTYDNQYWISLDNNNSTTPSTSSNKWHRALDGKTSASAATNAALQANTAAEFANTKAGLANTKAGLADQAATAANEAAEAALAAVVTAELPAVALESNVRAIVSGYTPSE
jgi:hypothetical protein